MLAARVTKQTAMILVSTGLGLVFALTGCSSDSSDPIKTADSGTSTAALSHAFGTQCSRCHGASGLGQGKYPKLPGKPDATTFIAFVRAGKDEMPSFTTAQISDADLTSDFAVLSGK